MHSQILGASAKAIIAVFKIVGASADVRANTKSARDLGRRLGHPIARQRVRSVEGSDYGRHPNARSSLLTLYHRGKMFTWIDEDARAAAYGPSGCPEPGSVSLGFL